MGIQITSEEYRKLQDIIKRIPDTKHAELEARIVQRYGKSILQIPFFRAVEYYMQANPTGTSWQQETLDIIDSNEVRTTISGLEAIQKYCLNNIIPQNATRVTKSREASFEIPEYAIKVALSSETPIDKDDIKGGRQQLTFRLKQRLTSVFPHFRVDLTIVKSNAQYRCVDLASARLNKMIPTYEAEIEYIDTNDHTYMQNDLIPDMFERLSELKKVLINAEYLIPASLYEAVSAKYVARAKMFLPPHAPDYFIGPKTSSIEHAHIQEDGMLVSARYALTHKADGERSLVFVIDGTVYTINNRMDLKSTGITVNDKLDYIFDAEIVDLGGHISIMLFDCYVNESENVGSKYMFEDRYTCITTFVANLEPSDGIFQIVAKTFVIADDIFKAAQELFETLPDFPTDGVIYTPVDMVVPKNAYGRTWSDVVKWKPPHENTIDFLVKVKKSENGFTTLALLVGSSRNRNDGAQFRPKGQYQEAIVPTVNGIMYCTKKGHTHEEINDDTIVEMAFINKRWEPLLVRYDKTEKYIMTRSISQTANDESVAEKTWKTINDPITKSNISQDNYYIGNTKEVPELKELRSFHNMIKMMLYMTFLKKSTSSLMDIGCGKGGDFHKYLAAGIRTVVGTDLNENNIQLAYGRLDKLDDKPENKRLRYVFLPMNALNPIHEEIEAIKDPRYRRLAQIMWANNNEVLEPTDRSSLYRIASNGFDAISCQFAIHFFFENEATLSTFIDNVDDNLKSKGYFIGTTFDGASVAAALETDKKIGWKTEKGGDIWYIEKKYKGEFDGKRLGLKIDSYIKTIDAINREFLVPFDLLVERFRERKIMLVETQMFGEMYNENPKYRMNENVKPVSMFNRWFVFRKN